MKSERNKQIAISVLQGMIFEDASLKHDITRKEVSQIVRRAIIRVDPKAAETHNIKALRKDCDRLIKKIANVGR
jgi:hypothetical protein